MNCDWRTVRKYVDMEDFSSPPPAPVRDEEHNSKLDPFKPQIDSWLAADKLAPRKQRHTAKRIYKRLKSENQDFSCSYRLVALYVRQRKEELNLNKTTGYIPLEHKPGEAQADFGTADFYENGKLHHEAKYLVLSFPYSNGGFFQLNYGENMDWVPYLTYIARKPRSLRNSGIYDMMPQTMRLYMDSCESKDRGRILKVLAELTERTGFISAVNTVNEAVRMNATDPDSLETLYRRTYADVPVLPPLDSEPDIPKQTIIPFRNDLQKLDAALHKGGAFNHG